MSDKITCDFCSELVDPLDADILWYTDKSTRIVMCWFCVAEGQLERIEDHES